MSQSAYPSFDVLIIGGGIVGCAAAYELSKYSLRIALLEAENDVSCGTTRANSAIVHAGYDPPTGSLMAKTNVRGAALTEHLCKSLSVPYRRCGALVLAFDTQDMQTLHALYARGQANGVPDLALLSPTQTHAMESALTPSLAGALYAPSCGIVSPWELAIALAGTAVRNGVQILTRHRVTGIRNMGSAFAVDTASGPVHGRFIVNAAGLFADQIHALAGGAGFTQRPVKGQYFLLDKSQGKTVDRVIFQCPTSRGKGVLLAPTVHGNLIVGPDSEETQDRYDLSTDAQRLSVVADTARLSVPALSLRDNIRSFAGLRAYADRDDFIIEPSAQVPRFINLAGIKSPGLTAAPAIAEMVPELLGTMGLSVLPKISFYDRREVVRIRQAPDAEKRRLLAANPLYGRVVCRCEQITEGEIVDAVHDALPPVSLDGVKRRCGAGMGRCQGGFCGSRVHEIMARETGLPMELIMQDLDGSYIVTGPTKVGDPA